MGKNKHAKPPTAKSASGSAASSSLLTPTNAAAAVAVIAVAYFALGGGGASASATIPSSGKSASDKIVPPPRKAASQQPDCSPDAPEDYMCPAWHKAGHCMHGRSGARQKCPKTCGLCDGIAGRVPRVSRDDRCQRDNRSAAVPQGELHPLFERILREHPEYNPTALSTSPYVLHLENFINEEEAKAFQNVCKAKFERSLAGDQLNPVRTSFQCWCNFPGCFIDPDVHNVTTRINRLLHIPYNNGEDLQIVRYEPGQFYRRHHDQNTAVWAPQGPRVLTFFMYLNQPEEGGETAFPMVAGPDGQKPLIVSPKLGSAILWPSTRHDQPMEADMRTDHEAMPVHKGIKYGANMWVHQFDFKTPSERGCELTYVNTVGRIPHQPEHRALVGDGRVPTYEETVKAAAQLDPQRHM